MTHDDELRSRMSRLSETHQLGELTVDAVHGRNDRRMRRQRFAGMAAVLLLIVAAAGIVRAISTGDETDVNVAADALEETTTTAPVPAGTPAASEDFAVPTTTVYFGDSAGSSADYGGSNNVVAWGDGFLEFGQIFVPSDVGFTDLVPDIADRFPPEVLEAIEAAGIENPGSGGDIQASIDVLTEAGLMDMVTDIFTNDPELLQAYNQVQSGGTYSFQASVSTDGETWTVLDDFVLPGNASYFDRVLSNGSTVVVATSEWADDAPPIITISSSSDLVTWSSTVLPVDLPATPAYVNSDVNLSALAVGPDGWYAVTGSSSWIDIWSLVPADVRVDFEDSAYGYSAEAGGIRITSYGDEYYSYDSSIDAGAVAEDSVTIEPLPVDAPARPEPPSEPLIVEERFLTWDELDITEAEYDRYNSGDEQASAAYLGGFGGSLEAVAPAQTEACCQVIATDAGFLASTYGTWNEDGPASAPTAYFSPDGRNWSEVDLPADVAPYALVAVSGGVVASNSNSGSTVWRANASGTDWQEVEIDGLPEGIWLSFNGGGYGGVATVIDAQPQYEYEQPEYTTVFEYEGYEFEIEFASEGSSTFLLTDLATGDVIIDEDVNTETSVQPDFIGDSVTGLEFIDADGSVIVEVPYDILTDATEAARQAAVEESGWVEPEYNFTPDYWLVATTDGLTWHVEDLVEIENRYYGEVVVNGGTVIMRGYDEGETWQVFSIG